MRRRIRLAISAAAVAGLAVFAASAAASSGGVAAGPRTSAAHHPSAATSALQRAQARAALVRYLSHHRDGLRLAHPAAHAVASDASASSFNWSGYADETATAGTFTGVTGSWTVPKVTCTAEDQLSAAWVGLDGATDSTVEQDGTTGWCFEGKAFYYDWYEMYPASSVTVGKSVQAGDAIKATVVRSGASYTLQVVDSTHSANTFTKNGSCATSKCLDKSAEWIMERPELNTGVAPLAKYGTWKLTNGAVATGSTMTPMARSAEGSITLVPITMIDSTKSYALSTTTGTASGFTTTWHNSY